MISGYYLEHGVRGVFVDWAHGSRSGAWLPQFRWSISIDKGKRFPTEADARAEYDRVNAKAIGTYLVKLEDGRRTVIDPAKTDKPDTSILAVGREGGKRRTRGRPKGTGKAAASWRYEDPVLAVERAYRERAKYP